jgi:hypothetical protein
MVACDTPSGPEDQPVPSTDSVFVLKSVPVAGSYLTHPDSVETPLADNLMLYADSMDTFPGFVQSLVEEMGPYLYDYTPAEIIVSTGDTARIHIGHCTVGQPWECYVRDTSDVRIATVDSVPVGPTAYELAYSVVFLTGDVGYIAFQEFERQISPFLSPNGANLIVHYVCDYVDSMYLWTDSLVWIYDTVGTSTLSLIMSGETNAYRVAVETYGDGALGMHSVALGPNGAFLDTVSIAFSHLSGVVNTNSSRAYLYGIVGDAKQVVLSNPLNGT